MFSHPLGIMPEVRTIAGLTTAESDAIREARRRLNSPEMEAASEAVRRHREVRDVLGVINPPMSLEHLHSTLKGDR